jgi:hypothetical protein
MQTMKARQFHPVCVREASSANSRSSSRLKFTASFRNLAAETTLSDSKRSNEAVLCSKNSAESSRKRKNASAVLDKTQGNFSPKGIPQAFSIAALASLE